MTRELPYILSYYNGEITQMISEKYGYNLMDSLRMFLRSVTYRMLRNPELEMWEFSPLGIFDMWETEQITGDPHNSLYIRRD